MPPVDKARLGWLTALRVRRHEPPQLVEPAANQGHRTAAPLGVKEHDEELAVAGDAILSLNPRAASTLST